MSYSKIGKALMLSVVLSACAHGASTHAASEYGEPTVVQTAGERSTDGPRFTRQQTAFLAGESRPHVSGGEVIVERENCSVWSGEASERCDLPSLVHRSITPGYTNW